MKKSKKLTKESSTLLREEPGELGRKVKSAAGDITQAGRSSSLRADLNKLVQNSSQQAQNFIKQFEEISLRAQNLGLESESQTAKNEIQALTDYMQNSSVGLSTVQTGQTGQRLSQPPKEVSPEQAVKSVTPTATTSPLDRPNKKGLSVNMVKKALAKSGDDAIEAANLLGISLNKIITKDDLVDVLMSNADLIRKSK